MSQDIKNVGFTSIFGGLFLAMILWDAKNVAKICYPDVVVKVDLAYGLEQTSHTNMGSDGLRRTCIFSHCNSAAAT